MGEERYWGELVRLDVNDHKKEVFLYRQIGGLVSCWQLASVDLGLSPLELGFSIRKTPCSDCQTSSHPATPTCCGRLTTFPGLPKTRLYTYSKEIVLIFRLTKSSLSLSAL